MAQKKKTGCIASVGPYKGIDYLCDAGGFPVDENFEPGPHPDCDYAVKSKRHDWCRHLWGHRPDLTGEVDSTCHCVEAKLQALDVLYKEIMGRFGKERYQLLRSWMRTHNRRKDKRCSTTSASSSS
jgi:hypothetical protein